MTDRQPCDGKRSYSGREWAIKAIAKTEKKRERGRRGVLHAYHCGECDGWHLGRSHISNRPTHRRAPDLEVPTGPSSGAVLYAEAEAVARRRHPDGASSGQLSAILRELLAGKRSSAMTNQPIVADSARLRPLDRRAIDLNEIAHEEYRARRKG